MSRNTSKDDHVFLLLGAKYGLHESLWLLFFCVAAFLIGPIAICVLLLFILFALTTGGRSIRLTPEHIECVGLLWRLKAVPRQNVVRIYPAYRKNGMAIAFELHSGKVIFFYTLGISGSAIGTDAICLKLSQEMGLPYTSYGKITQAVHVKLMYLVPLTVLGLVGLCALILYIAFVYA